MSQSKADEKLQIVGVYDADHQDAVVYEQLVSPQRVFRVSHFFIDHWLPLLGPSKAWLVVALQQACWRGSQPTPVAQMTQSELAWLSGGLSRKWANNLLPTIDQAGNIRASPSPLLSYFVKDIRPSYLKPVHRTQARMRTANSYQLLLNDPLTPDLICGLQAHFTRFATLTRRSTCVVEEALTELLARSRQELFTYLRQLATGVPKDIGPTTLRDLVQTIFPLPLDEDLLLRLSGLSHYLLQPNARGGVYIGTQYFRKKWLPRLGATRSWLVTVLRRHCFEDKRANLARNRFDLSKQALAHMLGLAVKTLAGYLKPASLKQIEPFFSEISVGRYRISGQIHVNDEPLTIEDEALFQQLKQALPTGEPVSIASSLPTPLPKSVAIQTRERINPGNGKEVTASGTEKRLQHQRVGSAEKVTASVEERLHLVAGNGKKVTDSAPEKALVQPIDDDLLPQDWMDHYFQQLGWQDTSDQQRKWVRNALLALPPDWQREYLSAWVDWYQKQPWVSPGEIFAAIRRGAWPASWGVQGEKGSPSGVQPAAGPVSDQSLNDASNQQKWQQALECLKLKLTKGTFDAWLRHTTLQQCIGDHLIIKVHNQYARDWLEHRLKHIVERVSSEIWSTAVQVTFCVAEVPVASDHSSPG